MKHILSMLSITLMVAACVLPVRAKGSPDKIIITGGKPAGSVEITDRNTLKRFDPWSGQFITWTKGAVPPPADQSRSFEVFFYMKWNGRHSNYDRGPLKLIYSLRYVPGSDGALGYIYLPGKGERFYNNNIGTILRENDDGKWHQASMEWDLVMKRLIAAQLNRQVNGWRQQELSFVGE